MCGPLLKNYTARDRASNSGLRRFRCMQTTDTAVNSRQPAAGAAIVPDSSLRDAARVLPSRVGWTWSVWGRHMPARPQGQRHSSVRALPRAALVLAALLALSACSSTNNRGATSPAGAAATQASTARPTAAASTGAARPSPTPAAQLGAFASMLQLTPDTPATRQQVTMSDYAGARRALGLSAPADPAAQPPAGHGRAFSRAWRRVRMGARCSSRCRAPGSGRFS